MNKVYLSLCKNRVQSRLSHGTEAAVCQRCSGLNYSTADITVHLFFIANICLACYIVTMICISSPDSMYKTNTWKVTRVVRTKGFSQCALGGCLHRVWCRLQNYFICMNREKEKLFPLGKGEESLAISKRCGYLRKKVTQAAGTGRHSSWWAVYSTTKQVKRLIYVRERLLSSWLLKSFAQRENPKNNSRVAEKWKL